MKFCVFAFLAVSAQAFVTPSSFRVRDGVRLFATRPDTTKEVAAALEASKKFGPTSKEARIAWEAVEEMDSSDNSNAYVGGSLNVDECEVTDSEECARAYHSKLIELGEILEEFEPKKDRAKKIVEEIQNIRLATPEVKAGADSPALRAALAAAKAATDEYGVDSEAAKLAWESVEEIGAARNYENALGGTLEDECLVEKIEACEGLDELKRVLNTQE